jgi:uncharacterized protein (DUF1015 family)
VVEVSAFNALRFDPAVAGSPGDVVCPPYDVIDDRARIALEARSPYNAVRLVLPQGDDPYAAARATLDAWRASGVLALDARPSLTVYEQTHTVAGARHTQRGLLAAVRLDDPADGGVLPHERTYDKIVDDRLSLLRAAETNLDCIFCVYESDGGASAVDRAGEAPPLARFTTPDGIEHALWRVDDDAAIEEIRAHLEKPRVVIADGHHRWRTAMRYRDERRATDGEGPWDFQLMLLVDASRFGPSLLPIHRLLADVDPDAAIAALREVFAVEDAPRADPEALAAELAARRRDGVCFAAFDASRAWWLTLRDEPAARAALPAERSDAWRALDVSILHGFVFDRLLGGVAPAFVHSATEAAEAVEAGRAALAFLLPPMPFEAVRAVAEAGDAMPQKSTYFIPKPATGVVLRPLA